MWFISTDCSVSRFLVVLEQWGTAGLFCLEACESAHRWRLRSIAQTFRGSDSVRAMQNWFVSRLPEVFDEFSLDPDVRKKLLEGNLRIP